MSVLYRKYRPQVFADLAGQEHVKKTLSEEVASGRLAHSYLFTGPRGVGKTTTARIFAKAVNCRKRKKGSGEPCGTCESCAQISEGRFLDVIEIDAASHTGVDNVREQIIEATRFTPSSGAYKVFVIDEVHMLSTSAFNALLKTLEEPPAHVMFILATTELHKLPATVVSRCQRFDFRKIPRDELLERLRTLVKAEKVKVDEDVLDAVARQSEGCLRDAESLLTQVLSMGDKHVTMETASLVLPSLSSDRVAELIVAVLGRDIPSALSIWERIGADGCDPHRTVADMLDLVRSLALAGLKQGGAEAAFPLSDERRTELASLGASMTSGDYALLLEGLMNVREKMKRVELAELPFEMMIMAWGEPATPAPQVTVSVQAPPPDTTPSTPTAPKVDSPESVQEEVKAETPDVKVENVATSAPAVQKETSKPDDGVLLAGIKKNWNRILEKCQEKNPGLQYMLVVGEILGVEEGRLQVGFQYGLYRDRLNGKCKRELEAVLSEVMEVKVLAEGVLKEKVVSASGDATEQLPEGFNDLVKDFGGSVA